MQFHLVVICFIAFTNFIKIKFTFLFVSEKLFTFCNVYYLAMQSEKESMVFPNMIYYEIRIGNLIIFVTSYSCI